jgi:parallel beta-helix repeat protein
VFVRDEGSQAVLRGNRIHDGKEGGVGIYFGASATLENNTITDNDLSGVYLQDLATATLTGNTIKGNGQCKIEQTEEELADWTEDAIVLYRSPTGFSGVRAVLDSTVNMPPGSNTIEGNGKVGSAGEHVMVDETSMRCFDMKLIKNFSAYMFFINVSVLVVQPCCPSASILL